MSGDLVALVSGTVLAVCALGFVLYPLFFARPERATAPQVRAKDDSAIVALREIEFDRATGKLSEADYAELRRTYGERALKEMRAADGVRAAAASVSSRKTAAAPTGDDPIEAQVRAYRMTHRECPTCGLRPEADAVYCSTCGAWLDRVCPACAAIIPESGSAFCSTCGVPIADSRSHIFG